MDIIYQCTSKSVDSVTFGVWGLVKELIDVTGSALLQKGLE